VEIVGVGLRLSSFMHVRGSINYCNEFWNYVDKLLNELEEYEVLLRRLIKQDTR
jgi:hypothetical protein